MSTREPPQKRSEVWDSRVSQAMAEQQRANDRYFTSVDRERERLDNALRQIDEQMQQLTQM